MGATADKTPERPTTEQELEQYSTAREEIENQIEELDTSDNYDPGDPQQRLFFASFDGTRNDRENPDPEYIHTNPDLMEDTIKESDTVSKEYTAGVGTDKNNTWLENAWQSATGNGCEDIAEKMYQKFGKQVETWHEEDPDIEVHVSSVGFSRGDGSQRHFVNLVYERGVPDPDGDGYLIPPGGIYQDLMLSYDSVVTGQEDILKLGVPQGLIAVHFTFYYENRVNFDSSSIVDPFNLDDPGII